MVGGTRREGVGEVRETGRKEFGQRQPLFLGEQPSCTPEFEDLTIPAEHDRDDAGLECQATGGRGGDRMFDSVEAPTQGGKVCAVRPVPAQGPVLSRFPPKGTVCAHVRNTVLMSRSRYELRLAAVNGSASPV